MKVSEEWGEVVELTHLSAGPIVFHFRPTKYIKVTPDRLKDWEEFTMANVGLRPDANLLKTHIHRRNGGPGDGNGWNPTPTISGSNDGWDDSDYW